MDTSTVQSDDNIIPTFGKKQTQYSFVACSLFYHFVSSYLFSQLYDYTIIPICMKSQ